VLASEYKSSSSQSFPQCLLLIFRHQLRAIQVDKLRKMAMENEKSSDANGIELEMTEARQPSHLAPP